MYMITDKIDLVTPLFANRCPQQAESGADVLTIGSDFGLSKWDEAACNSDNVILLTDSSRVCHYLQYPEETTLIYSYFESLGSKYDKTLFFGLQYILKKWMVGPVITVKKINDAKEFFRVHFNQELFNESGWMHIVEQHDGHLPLSIRAAPEGSLIPTRNVLFTVENTDPALPWLTGWFQTLLMQTWYPTTVATNAWHYKELLARYLVETCGSTASIPYQLHDFGFSGASSAESAAIGGAAHLVNFLSSDNIAGIRFVNQYYGFPMAGYSYPSTEHSDGMTLEMAEAVLANAKANRWSAQNVLLASDGTLMREPRGPAQRFAFQCSAAVVGGHEVILCGVCFLPLANPKLIEYTLALSLHDT
ncbi:hypothetical protein HPB50_005668 [Hyalomma asiaticum]|uniref:Uncharacterized protein n=1 Tax=Hyalomma asiaticum TaxID=266040 RepID=A0ACB7S0H8_HYAAI|nr:hypothetical protein HPB50_005668 [Hyalomma asiaticum]